jgi:hypothetical protein
MLPCTLAGTRPLFGQAIAHHTLMIFAPSDKVRLKLLALMPNDPITATSNQKLAQSFSVSSHKLKRLIYFLA